jgi:phage gp45-like
MGTENTVKLAIKSMGIEDTTPTDNGENKNPIQQMQIQTYDAVKQCGKLGHYGYYGNAPKNSLVVVIQANGQEECLYGVEDDVNNRPRNLKEGEVMVYNTLTKNYIYFDEEGNTRVYAKKDMKMKVEGAVSITVVGNADITCPQSTLNGNAIVNGDTTLNGNLTVTGDTRVDGTMSAGVVKADNGATGSGDVVTYADGIVTG